MRGRIPKPTARKILEGNPGKRPLNTNEPQLPMPTNAFDRPPRELSGNTIARAEWRRLAPMLRRARVISEAERGALLTLCQQWAIYVEAHANVRKVGMVVKAPSGYPIVNPYLGIANKAFLNCKALWAELGLTPSARSRVNAGTGADADDDFALFDDDGDAMRAARGAVQ